MTELDEKSIRVLVAIDESDGEATTTEIKSKTGIEDNHKVTYRLRKMAESGLIETHQPLPETKGAYPAKQAELTDSGAEEIADLKRGDGGCDYSDQLQRIISQQQELLTRLDRLEESVGVSCDDDVPAEDVSMQEITRGFVAVQRVLESEFNLNLAHYAD